MLQQLKSTFGHWFGLSLIAMVLACGASQNPHIASGSASDQLESGDLDAKIELESFDVARMNAAIFHATNEARMAEGLDPVEQSALLEELATDYAARLVSLDTMSHNDPETGDGPQERYLEAGIVNPISSENLANNGVVRIGDGEEFYPINPERGLISREPGGPPVPFHTYASLGRALVESWLNSPGHRANLLNEKAVQLGCGAALDRSKIIPVVVGVQNFQNHRKIQAD